MKRTCPLGNDPRVEKIFPDGRHGISQRVRIGAPITKQTERNRKGQQQNIMFLVSCVLFQMSHVICHVFHVTCQMSLRPTATDPPPRALLTLPPCTVGWFAKTPKHKQNLIAKKLQNGKKKNRKCIEVCQYMQYTLHQEVSSPPGSGVFKSGQTDRSRTSQLNQPRGLFSKNPRTGDTESLNVCTE